MPNDLEVSGPKETFVPTLSDQTLDLYGKIDATVPFVLEAKP